MTDAALPAPSGVLRPPRFARALGGAALAACGARAAQFLMAMALVAQLGPAGFGEVAFALGTGALAGQLGAGGWPALGMRSMAGLVAAGDAARLRRLMDACVRGALTGALATAAALALVGAAVVWAGGEALGRGLLLAAVVAPTAAVRRVGAQQLAGLFLPARGLALEDLAPPAAVLLFAGVAGASDPVAPVLLFAAAGAVSGPAALMFARRAARTAPAASTPTVESDGPAAWPREARALFGALAPRMLLGRADMLLIAPLLGFEAAGLYAAAQRLAYLVTAPPLLLSQVLQPWISRAVHAGDGAALRRALHPGLGAVALWVLPSAAGAAIFAGPLCDLLGAEFAASAALVPALTAAEGLTALGAPLVVLAVAGPGVRAFGRIGLALAACHAALIVVAAPVYGVQGAAWSAAAASVVLFGSVVWLARATLRRMR